MSATLDCNCSCPTPVVTTVPGTEGATGEAGSNGVSAVATTSGVSAPPSFNKPQTGILVNVDSSAGFYIGEYVTAQDVDGSEPGFFQVDDIPSSTSLSLTYLDITNNANGVGISAGKLISPSGPQYFPGTLPNSFTDQSTGTVSDSIQAGAGVFTLSIPIVMSHVAAAGDILTTYTPGYKFKILKVDAVVSDPATPASKAFDVNLEIDTTNLTGGVIQLTSANCSTQGTVIPGTPIGPNNVGTALQSFSVEASNVVKFDSGQVSLLIKIQNMDTADAIASLAAHIGSNALGNSLINALS